MVAVMEEIEIPKESAGKRYRAVSHVTPSRKRDELRDLKLSVLQQKWYIREIKKGNRHLQGNFLCINEGLIYKVLCDEFPSFFPQIESIQDDLLQAGRIGLMIAAEKFDFKRKSSKTGKPVKFSTYAWTWIKYEAEKALYHMGYVDRGVKKRIAGRMIHNVIKSNDDERHLQIEGIVHARSSLLEEIHYLYLVGLVHDKMEGLPERDKKVLYLYYFEGIPDEQIGKTYNMTREGARQAKIKGLKILRRHFVALGVGPEETYR